VDQEEMPAYAELTRRLGFEYNGMVLHEYYFGNLKRGGGLVGDQLQQREQTLAEQQRAIEEQRQELARNRDLLEELKRRNLEARETERGVVVNLPDVLFEFGRATLTPAAREKTREIAHVLTTQARDRRVLVEGHTD
jgi:flagellar motor protein MotB